MPSNAYFLSKFRFDTAENEPANILQNSTKFCKNVLILLLFFAAARGSISAPSPLRAELSDPRRRRSARRRRRCRARPLQFFRKCIFEKCILRKFCKFLAGSFSAVSKRNFARKYAFGSIFQALQDVHTSAPLQTQNFSQKSVEKVSNQFFVKFEQKIANFAKSAKCCQLFENSVRSSC